MGTEYNYEQDTIAHSFLHNSSSSASYLYLVTISWFLLNKQAPANPTTHQFNCREENEWSELFITKFTSNQTQKPNQHVSVYLVAFTYISTYLLTTRHSFAPRKFAISTAITIIWPQIAHSRIITMSEEMTSSNSSWVTKIDEQELVREGDEEAQRMF